MQDFIVKELRQIQGVGLVEPTGAFYVLPDMSNFCGASVEGQGFGPIPDTDTLCRQVLFRAHALLQACWKVYQHQLDSIAAHFKNVSGREVSSSTAKPLIVAIQVSRFPCA